MASVFLERPLLLTQTVAGAQAGGRLAEATRAALDKWIVEVRTALERVLAGSPLAEVAYPSALAHTVSESFLGLTMFESVDLEGGEQALEALGRLAELVDALEGLGPIATRAVREAPQERQGVARKLRHLSVRSGCSSTVDHPSASAAEVGWPGGLFGMTTRLITWRARSSLGSLPVRAMIAAWTSSISAANSSSVSHIAACR